MKWGRIQPNQESGFSLIELLIVIGILGLVGLIAIPSISNTFRFSVQSSGREIATLIKDTVNSAQITGRVHRIAYDLKNQQYWVESTSESTLLKSDETLKKEKERSRGYFSQKEAEEEAEEEAKAVESAEAKEDQDEVNMMVSPPMGEEKSLEPVEAKPLMETEEGAEKKPEAEAETKKADGGRKRRKSKKTRKGGKSRKDRKSRRHRGSKKNA